MLFCCKILNTLAVNKPASIQYILFARLADNAFVRLQCVKSTYKTVAMFMLRSGNGCIKESTQQKALDNYTTFSVDQVKTKQGITDIM